MLNQNVKYNLSFSKAGELLELISQKTTSNMGINDQVKKNICVDISCELLNIPLDSHIAGNLSGLRKVRYQRQKNSLMKIMNLNKQLDVTTMMLKLRITNSNVEKTANKILEAFRKDYGQQMDLDHPQYVAVSVYKACMLAKVKVVKKNIIAASNLKANQWSKLEKACDKLVNDVEKFSEENEKDSESGVPQHSENKPGLTRKLDAEPEVEDYDEWAKRTLTKARADLNDLKLKEKEA